MDASLNMAISYAPLNPLAKAVARAVIAAAKEMRADPEDILRGVRGVQNGIPRELTLRVSRARAYAALALRAVCEDITATSISRMVGAGTPAQYLAQLDTNRKEARMNWWDDAVFMRVVQAIEEGV